MLQLYVSANLEVDDDHDDVVAGELDDHDDDVVVGELYDDEDRCAGKPKLTHHCEHHHLQLHLFLPVFNHLAQYHHFKYNPYLCSIDAVENNLMRDNLRFPLGQAGLSHLVQAHAWVVRIGNILMMMIP